MDKSNPSVEKLRRFGLSIGLILFTYSAAGVKMSTDALIEPLGIPLRVTRPDLLGIGLAVGCVYSAARFYYYCMLRNSSPGAIRSRLMRGRLSGRYAGQVSSDILFRNAHREITEAFPGIADDGYTISTSGGEYELEILPLPVRTRVLAAIETLDFTAPIWLNIIAVMMFLISVVK
jgi:hypothetical protein